MKNILLITLIFSSHFLWAQKMPSDYFKEAENYAKQKNYDKAFSAFQYIVDNYPKNELYPRAYYNTSYIQFKQKHYKKAVKILKAILTKDFNEKEPMGGNIMADPYANYKHRASKFLSTIYYAQKDYHNALHYLAVSDTVYPYLNYCANGISSNNIQTALQYADLYEKLKKPQKAIQHLLPFAFSNLADNSLLIQELKKLLKPKKGIKKKLDKSLETIHSEKVKAQGHEFTRYYFKYMNTKITIEFTNNAQKEKFDKKKAIERIQTTTFYKMIKSL